MVHSLLHRSLLRVEDLSAAEFGELIDLADALKAARRTGRETPRLCGRTIALIFEKTSTRTRCAFEVAAYQQGAHVTCLDPASAQLGHKESIADTGRVLGRMFDAIQYRGASQTRLEQLAASAGVPVYNGLTDDEHPTQMLADVMTMREYAGGRSIEEIAFAYVGDARYNMGCSLMLTGCLLGMDVRIGAPRALWPAPSLIERAEALKTRSGGRLLLCEDPLQAVRGADFVHTDVWVSMGEPQSVWDERIALLRPYRVDHALLQASCKEGVKFMHCLPALHDEQTEIGRMVAERYGLAEGVEVSDEVFQSSANIAFDQAENRMHTIKALLVASLAKEMP